MASHASYKGWDPQCAEAEILFRQGPGLREIGRRLGRSPNTVLSWAHRAGWKVRENQTAAAQIVQKSAQNVMSIGADYLRETGQKCGASLANSCLKGAVFLEAQPGYEIAKMHQSLEGITKAASRVHNWAAEDQACSVISAVILATPAAQLPSREVQVLPQPQPGDSD